MILFQKLLHQIEQPILKIFGENPDISTMSIKQCKFYQTAKDTNARIRKELRRQGLDFEYSKVGRLQGYRYPVHISDPIAHLKRDNKRMRLKQIERLIDASVGLFPDSWLTKMLLTSQHHLQGASAPIISFDHNFGFYRIDIIPTLYDAIENKQVIHFCYHPNYSHESVELVFHPYFLKEYNQCWHLFGKAFLASNGLPAKYAICTIDRIRGEITTVDPQPPFIPNTTDWNDYFAQIIGVTRRNGQMQEIVFETTDETTFFRILRKPIHSSQKVLCFHNEANMMRGKFSINVIPNEELLSVLLSFRSGITVIAPSEYVNTVRREMELMSNNYATE